VHRIFFNEFYNQKYSEIEESILMTEADVFDLILGIKEIHLDRVDGQDQCIPIYCSSVFEEALCPHCLNKRQVVNQTDERQVRDFPIAGREVYLHLSQRPFYGPDCHRHFTERFGFVDPQRTMTRRYERSVDECGKANTLQKVSAQENIIWNTLNELFQRYSREELRGRPVVKIRAMGMDKFAMKKGHRDFSTGIVDFESAEIIDILEYRDPQRWIEYFKN
jgi:transposase